MELAYPSIDELMPQVLLSLIPASLAAEIRERYLTLGDKYQTMYQHTDGRFINGMMFTDRIDNCLEEVVDAVFCILGQIFKDTEVNIEPSANLYSILEGFIHIYSLLMMEKELHALAR